MTLTDTVPARPAGTVSTILRHRATDSPEAAALVFDDLELTYGQLLDLTLRCATALRTHGVGRGDRVVTVDRTSAAVVVQRLAVAHLGAIDVPLNWRLADAELTRILDDLEPAWLMLGPADAHRAEALGGHAEHLHVVRRPDYSDFLAWVHDHEPLAQPPGSEPGDTASILFSSGTTGRPKGVEVTHAALALRCEQAPTLWGLGSSSVMLAAMPLFHVGGSSWVLNGLHLGARVVLSASTGVEDLLTLIDRHRITHAFVAPALLRSLLEKVKERGAVPTSIQVLGYGAAAMPPALLAEARDVLRCDFAQSYGMTETTGSSAMLTSADHAPGSAEHRWESVGRACPGVELRIVDPDSRELRGAGEPGEVELRTPHPMKGYWRNPELTAQVLAPDGWYATGDLGVLDADGYLYLSGRRDDLINTGGEKVQPAEVEAVLVEHPAVSDAAVVAAPSERWGQTPVAFVVLTDPGTSGADLIEFCRSRIAHFKCPSAVAVVAEIPRNAAGKIDRLSLRERLTEVAR